MSGTGYEALYWDALARAEKAERELAERTRERDAARTEALTCLEARRKALVRSEEVIMGLQAERDAAREALRAVVERAWNLGGELGVEIRDYTNQPLGRKVRRALEGA